MNIKIFVLNELDHTNYIKLMAVTALNKYIVVLTKNDFTSEERKYIGALAANGVNIYTGVTMDAAIKAVEKFEDSMEAAQSKSEADDIFLEMYERSKSDAWRGVIHKTNLKTFGDSKYYLKYDFVSLELFKHFGIKAQGNVGVYVEVDRSMSEMHRNEMFMFFRDALKLQCGLIQLDGEKWNYALGEGLNCNLYLFTFIHTIDKW